MANGTATLDGLNIGRGGGTVRFKVKEVDASNWQDFVMRATQAAGIPQKDASVLSGLVVLEHPRVVEIYGSDKCAVEISVGQRDSGGGGGTDTNAITIDYDATVVDVPTQLDFSGKAIRVFYTPGRPNGVQVDNFDQESPGQGYAPTQGGQVTKREPVDVLRMTRYETSLKYVVADRGKFIGFKNERTWWNKDPGAWLMTRIAAQLTYRDQKVVTPFPVTYEWQSRLDGWDQIAWWIVKETGQPPADATPFTPNAKAPRIRMLPRPNLHQNFYSGYTLVRVQGLVDYGTLGLPNLSGGA